MGSAEFVNMNFDGTFAGFSLSTAASVAQHCITYLDACDFRGVLHTRCCALVSSVPTSCHVHAATSQDWPLAT